MLDAAVRLEVNHWNGAVEPRVVLREVYPLDAATPAVSPHPCECDDAEWWARFEAELDRDLGTDGAVERTRRIGTEKLHTTAGGSPRQVVESGGSSPTVTIAELVSSGAGVLAVAADASRRAALANGATGLARFNGGAALIACHRCGSGAVVGLAARGTGGLALVDYAALAMSPDLAASFEHVVLVDAPRSSLDVARVAAGEGFLHPLFSEAEREFGLGVLGRQAPSRETIAGVFRALRGSGQLSGSELRAALAGPGPHPLDPDTAARAFRVLLELGLVAGSTNSGAGLVGVVSSEGTDLERSAAFRVYSKAHSEAQSFLQSPKFP